jgi:hypothetical protein
MLSANCIEHILLEVPIQNALSQLYWTHSFRSSYTNERIIMTQFSFRNTCHYKILRNGVAGIKNIIIRSKLSTLHTYTVQNLQRTKTRKSRRIMVQIPSNNVYGFISMLQNLSKHNISNCALRPHFTPRRSFLSEYHAVSGYKRKCYFIYAHRQGLLRVDFYETQQY